jgi:hypothetical protein
MERIAGPLSDLEPLLVKFDPSKDAEELNRQVKHLREKRLRDDEADFMEDEDLEELVQDQEPDWDLRGLIEDG